MRLIAWLDFEGFVWLRLLVFSLFSPRRQNQEVPVPIVRLTVGCEQASLYSMCIMYRGLGERSALIGCRVSIRSRCMETWGWKGLNELTTAGIWSEMLTEEDTANSHQITVLIVDCTQSQWFPSPSCFRGSSYWLEKWTFSFAYNPYWIVMIVPAITQTRGQRKLAPVKTLDFDRKTHNYINQWSFFFSVFGKRLCLYRDTIRNQWTLLLHAGLHFLH